MSLNNDKVDYLSGENFTKNDLKKRLRKMKVEFNEVITTKNYFVELYDNSLKNEKNRKLIEKELQNDKDILNQRGKSKREKTKIENNVQSPNCEEKSIKAETIRKITVIKIGGNKKIKSKNNQNETQIKENKIIERCYKIQPKNEKIMSPSEEPKNEAKEHSEKRQLKKLYISPVKQTRFSMDNIMLKDKQNSPFLNKDLFDIILNRSFKGFPNQVKTLQNSESVNCETMPITPTSNGNKGTVINGGIDTIHLSPNLTERELNKIHNCLYSPFMLLSSAFSLCAFGFGCYYISRLSFYPSFSSLFEKIEFTSIKDALISSVISLKEKLFCFLSNTIKEINPYYAVTLIILVVVGYILYKRYKDKKIAQNIYVKVKDELKKINEVGFTKNEFNDHFEIGLSENEIIKKYSIENGMNEKKFVNNVFPIMKKLRKKDAHIKEYENYTTGKKQTIWQWTN